MNKLKNDNAARAEEEGKMIGSTEQREKVKMVREGEQEWKESDL